MATATVNPDLARARAQATFDPLQLTHFLYDGAEKTKRKRFLQNIAIKECKEQNFQRAAELSREEQYEEALRKSTYAYQRIGELGLKDPTELYLFREVIFPSEPSPFGLHDGMFIATIDKQGTEEQKAKWLPVARRFGVIGTYVQTELGHGTFLRGLETTATYDPKTKEFVINSPTITSAKFWPGGRPDCCVCIHFPNPTYLVQTGGSLPLRQTHSDFSGCIYPIYDGQVPGCGSVTRMAVEVGKTANSCVVMANLNTKGREYGMQSFLVQIRDLDTHQPLPGVTVGDIGQKFGYSAMDNGFLILKNVRIPRENMLMRYAQVLEDGTFVSPKSDRLVYGSMTLVRSQIVGGCARALSKAVTIATRYSAVRKQSEINAGEGEVPVLDFQTQQHKLFIQIASAYALNIAGRASAEAYIRVSKQIESGNLDDLPILHALSAGLKTFSSWEMMYGIEQCRLACGGHGYMLASGLPKIYVNEVPACTYEGENTVLCLQTARFLIKCYNAAERGEQLPILARFLQTSRGGKSRLTEKLELDQIIAAYEHRAASKVAEANSRIQTHLKKGLKSSEAWNSASQTLVEASVAFSHAFVVRAFIEKVTNTRLEPSLSAVLIQLVQLYSLHGISSNAGQFLKGGYLSDQQLELVESKVYELLAALKPNAVALVDAFDFPDHVLDSDLGRYDGNVYEALMEYARRSKLNKTEVHDGFYKYQKPFVDSLKAKSRL